jgi:hypothetical protein
MVGLQSCRTAAISATALDLNNYQTGKTLKQGEIAPIVQMAYAPSIIGSVGGTQAITALPVAVAAMTGVEFGIAHGWSVGLAGQLSSTRLFLDMDAGFKGFVKTALTDATAPVSIALLLNCGILWGTESSTKEIRYGIFTPPMPISMNGTITHGEISSQANRVGLALPVSWTAIKPDSLAQATSYTVLPDIDIIITPGLHLVHQNLYLKDTVFIVRNFQLTPVSDLGARTVSQSYVIPSLSIGLAWAVSAAQIFPEATVSWTNIGLVFGLGFCIRGFLPRQ